MRKTYVRVPQSEYLNLLKTINRDGQPEWCCVEDIATYFDVSLATARRKLDGLVYQGFLEVIAGRPGPREYRYVRNER